MKRIPAIVLLGGLWVSLGVGGEEAAVPWSLGRGTGGNGAWSVGHPEHSPSRVAIEPAAGPEGTPAAALEFTFSATTYNWNWATVETGGADPSASVAVRVTYRTEVPAGFPPLNVMVREAGSAAYWVSEGLPLSRGRFATVSLPLRSFTLPAWSRDSNGRLDVDAIRQVSVGLASSAAGTGRVLIAEVELVPAGW